MASGRGSRLLCKSSLMDNRFVVHSTMHGNIILWIQTSIARGSIARWFTPAPTFPSRVCHLRRHRRQNLIWFAASCGCRVAREKSKRDAGGGVAGYNWQPIMESRLELSTYVKNKLMWQRSVPNAWV